jgi:hypothetical protein
MINTYYPKAFLGHPEWEKGISFLLGLKHKKFYELSGQHWKFFLTFFIIFFGLSTYSNISG